MRKLCRWKETPNFILNRWYTSCGNVSYIDSTPLENRLSLCPYCGEAILQEKIEKYSNMAKSIFFLITATEYTPTIPELNSMAETLYANDWIHFALGTGPQGDCDFVSQNSEEFSQRVHSAVFRIIKEIRKEKNDYEQ